MGDLLNKSSEESIAEKLQLKEMAINTDMQIFTAPREKAKQMIALACDLPGKICESMAMAAEMTEGKYHKKDSVPLDGHKGSYYAVWIWVKTVGPNDKVQVAMKMASMKYQLRDVVTYTEKVEYEPVIKCERTESKGLFSSESSENCRKVDEKKIVSSLPVFTPTVLTFDEMGKVDKLIETMLAKKVIENTGTKVSAINE